MQGVGGKVHTLPLCIISEFSLGRLDDMIGYFPMNYVSKIEPEKIVSHGIMKALYDFEGVIRSVSYPQNRSGR